MTKRDLMTVLAMVDDDAEITFGNIKWAQNDCLIEEIGLRTAEINRFGDVVLLENYTIVRVEKR